jgi:hypothetical protein
MLQMAPSVEQNRNGEDAQASINNRHVCDFSVCRRGVNSWPENAGPKY